MKSWRDSKAKRLNLAEERFEFERELRRDQYVRHRLKDERLSKRLYTEDWIFKMEKQRHDLEEEERWGKVPLFS